MAEEDDTRSYRSRKTGRKLWYKMNEHPGSWALGFIIAGSIILLALKVLRYM